MSLGIREALLGSREDPALPLWLTVVLILLVSVVGAVVSDIWNALVGIGAGAGVTVLVLGVYVLRRDRAR